MPRWLLAIHTLPLKVRIVHVLNGHWISGGVWKAKSAALRAIPGWHVALGSAPGALAGARWGPSLPWPTNRRRGEPGANEDINIFPTEAVAIRGFDLAKLRMRSPLG